jgi:hypothetical protein
MGHRLPWLFQSEIFKFESPRKYGKMKLPVDHMCGLDDDRGFAAFSKTSMPNTPNNLASAKQEKGKKKHRAAISFPRNYLPVTQLDSTESESSDDHTAQHALPTRELNSRLLSCIDA